MMEKTTNSHVWAGVLVKMPLGSHPQIFSQRFDFVTMPRRAKMIGFGPVKFGPMCPSRPEPSMDSWTPTDSPSVYPPCAV